MDSVNRVLLFFHFLGLALGFSVSFANMVMGGLISKATASEKAVLGRFPPIMSRLGRTGLALLWVTGAILVYTRWGGVAALPWQFDVKLAAVVLLTVTTTYLHRLEWRAQQGDASAISRIEALGKAATSLALVAVIFSVLTFD